MASLDVFLRISRLQFESGSVTELIYQSEVVKKSPNVVWRVSCNKYGLDDVDFLFSS